MKKTPLILLSLCAAVLAKPLALSANNTPVSQVQIFTEVDKPVVLAGNGDNVVIKVGLSALQPQIQRERLPFNLAIVLDKSGSMGSQGKMENAKNAAIEIISRLNRNDIVTLVVYDSEPNVVISSRPLINKDEFIRAISRIQSGGSTALYGGISLAGKELRRNLNEDFINRIILLSDGLANVGPQSTEELSSFGGILDRDGINVSTVGVGLDYNEDLMTALAQQSGGNSYFARNSDELPEIFAQEVGEAMTLTAKAIRIRLHCPKGVTPLRVIGRDGTISWNAIEAKIPNLYGLNEKYALFEINVPAQKSGAAIEIARVRIDYTDPYTKETITERSTVTVRFDSDAKTITRAWNKGIIRDVALTRTAEIKDTAIELADQGQYRQAGDLLKKRGAELEKIAQICDNDPGLLREARENQAFAVEIQQRQQMTKFQRKAMKNASWIQKSNQYEPYYLEQQSLNTQTYNNTVPQRGAQGFQTSVYGQTWGASQNSY